MSRMQKYSDSEIMQSLDEAEDLTLYADESFDTDDVDLFEFTSEDDSPLTNLKSIVLSLDWEINVEILDEMLDEIRKLQSLWQGDKVLNIYLQGLAKIGTYIKNELANAHPNSVKMLLIFYSNLEKIVSSENLSDDEVKRIVSDDIRKFRIMRYQISRRRISSLTEAPVEGGGKENPESVEKKKELRRLQAIILGIDWEISDKTLQSLTREIDSLSFRYKNDSCISALLQGLRSLGRYIALEKSHTHPDAFPLLHSFYEGIEKTVLNETLGEEEKKHILIEKIDKLNTLRSTVADEKPLDDDWKKTEVDHAGPVEQRETGPVAENQDTNEQDEEMIEDIAFLSDVEEADDAADSQKGLPADDAAPIAALSGFTEDHHDAIKDDDLAVDLSDEIDSHISNFFSEELGEAEQTSLNVLDGEDGEQEEATLKDVLFTDDDSSDTQEISEADSLSSDDVAAFSGTYEPDDTREETLLGDESGEHLDADDKGPLDEQLDKFFNEDDDFFAVDEDKLDLTTDVEEMSADDLISDNGEVESVSEGEKDLLHQELEVSGEKTSLSDISEEDIDVGLDDFFDNEETPALDGDDLEAFAGSTEQSDDEISSEVFSDKDIDNRLDRFFNEESESADVGDTQRDALSESEDEFDLNIDQFDTEFNDDLEALNEKSADEVAGFFDDESGQDEKLTETETEGESSGLGALAAATTAGVAGGLLLNDEKDEDEFIQDIDPANIIMLDDDEDREEVFESEQPRGKSSLFIAGAGDLDITDNDFEEDDLLKGALPQELDETSDLDDFFATDLGEIDASEEEVSEIDEELNLLDEEASEKELEQKIVEDESSEDALESVEQDEAETLKHHVADLSAMMELLSGEDSTKTAEQCTSLIETIQQSDELDEGQGALLQLLHSSLDSVVENIGDSEKTITMSESLCQSFITSTEIDSDQAATQQTLLVAAMGRYIIWQQGLIREIMKKTDTDR